MHANNAMPPASRRTNNNNLKPPRPAPSSPPLARSLGALAFLFHACDILDWVLGRNGKNGFHDSSQITKPPLLLGMIHLYIQWYRIFSSCFGSGCEIYRGWAGEEYYLYLAFGIQAQLKCNIHTYLSQ